MKIHAPKFDRRVLQVLALYLGGAWGLVQFISFIEQRYGLTTRWTDIGLLAFALLIPSVIIVTSSRDRDGGLRWTRAKRFAIAINVVLAGVILFVVFQPAATAVSGAPCLHSTDAQRWAVIIGVGDYESDEFEGLPFAAPSAQALYDFLLMPMAGPVDRSRTRLLTNRDATAQAMRDALFIFLNQAQSDDLVLVYFAGLVRPDPWRADNVYLLPHDANPDSLAATAFPIWDLQTAFRRQIKANCALIITDVGTLEPGTPGSINESFGRLAVPERRVILSASRDSRSGTPETDAFTGELIAALKGAADANNDGVVTLRELTDHTTGNVKADTLGQHARQSRGVERFPDIPLSTPGSRMGRRPD